MSHMKIYTPHKKEILLVLIIHFPVVTLCYRSAEEICDSVTLICFIDVVGFLDLIFVLFQTIQCFSL